MKKNKILVCGDIHTKLYVIELVKNAAHLYDKIIFLGDYVDEWGAAPEDSYNTLVKLLELKKDLGDKVVLILGNHDLSEWFGEEFSCSGFSPVTHLIVKPLMEDNQNLFTLAYAIDNILFTHAGLTGEWVKDNEIEFSEEPGTKAQKFAHELQWAFLSRNDNEYAHKIFKALNNAGPNRGGLHSPSPIWADYTELLANPVSKMDQIVGHSPVKTVQSHTITNGDKTENKLYFCDTHSLYSTRSPIGDGSFLEINQDTDEIRPIYLEERSDI